MKKLEAGQSSSSEFPEMSSGELVQIEDLLAGRYVGQYICHLWEENDEEVFYHGRIRKYLKGKKSYVISYWGESESFDDASDFTFPAFKLATDFYLKDLTI
jgi:hypothetical protein